MNKTRYILFPIELLQETDIKKVCRQAFDYGIYRQALNYLDIEYSNVECNHIGQSMEYFGLVVGNLERRAVDGRVLYHTFCNSPLVSINIEILMQYGKEEKTEFEVLVFRAFCAIRSIIGVKPYAKATNSYLVSRMYGFVKNGKVETVSRYKLDKIKLELQLSWGLIYYANNMKGFYVSYKLTIEKLIEIVEKKRASYREKELKLLKDEAYKKVIQRLNKPP